MGNSKLFFNTTTSKINYPTRLAAFFITLFFITLNVTAQDSLRQFLNTEKSTKTTKKTSDTKPRYTPRSSTRNTAARNSSKAAKVVKITRGPVTVTFITAEPFAEVWLNDKKSGQTNEDSMLEKKLPMGEYRVMVRNKVRVIYPLTKISISPDQTTFKLFEEKTATTTPVKATAPVVLSDEEKLKLAKDIGTEIKRIFNDYADPQKTDSVTTSDWELVYRAAQVNQLQGYSAVETESQRWFASGQLELAKENYTNAFTAFNKATEYMPTSGLLYYAIGNTYLANKQTSDALKAYQRSLQLTPKMGMVYKKLGDAYRILEKEKEAIAAYKNAVQFGYDNVETRLGLALTLLQTKQIDDAITQLLEVEKQKKSAEVYLALGEAYERTKRDVSAIEYYLKAVQAAPTSPVAYFKLGDVYYSQREYTKAKQAFEKAIELDPEGKVLNRNEAQKKLREAASKIK